tara:strand:+ start:263 stop:727 length:465 start_codon:yes stop_codon:yes gene_type:complete
MAKNITYHYATKKDIIPLTNLASDLHAEAKLLGNFNKKRYSEYLTRIFNNNNFLYLARDNRKLVGALVAYKFNFIWDDKHIKTMDCFWYVYPEYRGTMMGIKLLREYKKWATSFPNCLEIGIATSVDINVDRTSKLLNKLGFNTIGTVHRLTHD